MEILHNQWDRDYLLTFYNPEPSNPNGKANLFTITNLRCTFDATLYVDNKEKTNKGSVSIYNMTEDTIKKLGQKFGRIVLGAGYKGHISTIIEGDVINIRTEKQGVDRVTTFELAPNFIDLAVKKIAYAFPKGVTLKALIDGIALQFGIARPATAEGKAWEKVIAPYGYPAYGTGKQVLDEVTRTYGLEWKIIDGVLHVTDRYGILDNGAEIAFVLSKDTGMIDIPYMDTEEVSKTMASALSETEEKLFHPPTFKKDGTPRKQTKYKVRRYSVRVKALLNPLARPNALFKIETSNDDFKGLYRVRSVNFKGDTRGNDWYMEIYGDQVEGVEYE